MSGPAFETLARGAPAAGGFDAAALVQALLDTEAALVHARVDAGLTVDAAAAAIAGVCKAGLFDPEALVAAGALRGSAVAELVERLRETVALFDPVAAADVHRGLADDDLFELAWRVLLRRALAVLDDRLSQLAEAAPGAAAGAAAVASGVLRMQQRIRCAGSAALRWTDRGEAGAPAAMAWRCAQRLELADGNAADPPDPGPLDADDAPARLACAVSAACADLEPVAAGLRGLADANADRMLAARAQRAEQMARGAALRAPHRLAAWVACSGPRGSRSSAAAEMVALFDAVSSGAAELAEIARRLQGPAHARSAADERPAAALAPRQRAAAPWQRWLV